LIQDVERRERDLAKRIDDLAQTTQKLSERERVYDARLATCDASWLDLTTRSATLDKLAAQIAEREQACHDHEQKFAAWKNALELRELRAEKRDREIVQLIEKHALQAELKNG